MIHKEIIDNQLFLWMNGKLTFKRWLKDNKSVVFDDCGTFDKHTLKSIYHDKNSSM